MKHLPWLLCVLLVVGTVSAQESSVPSTKPEAGSAPDATPAPLVIEVRAQRVSRSALSEALAKELSQNAPSGDGEKPAGALELSDSASDTVRLTYRDALGRVTTRDLFLAPNDPEALEKITIAAANLVRDQTGALSQLEAAQRAEQEAAFAALAKPAVPAAPLPAAPATAKPAYDPCKPSKSIPFGVDLLWGVGTSSTEGGRQSARHVSLGLAGTYSAGTSGFELSIAANIDLRGTCGVQLAAGFNLSLGDLHGLQLAVANATLGRVHGAQIGVANFALKGAAGVQIGVVNVAIADAKLQLGVVNVAIGATDMQLGVANLAQGTSAAQMGVANVNVGAIRGQFGVANVATGATRTQIGVVNYAQRSVASVGVISIVPDGHTTLDAWVNENGALYGMLTHGGDRVYNMYGVGTRIQGDGMRLALAYGIASRLYRHPRFSLDLQAIYELYPLLGPWRMRSQVERFRFAADIKLTDRISLVPAVGYAIMFRDYASEPIQAPFGVSEFKKEYVDSNGKRHTGLYGFPSFGLGVRVLLSNPNKPRE
jgi:hypothetical protein